MVLNFELKLWKLSRLYYSIQVQSEHDLKFSAAAGIYILKLIKKNGIDKN